MITHWEAILHYQVNGHLELSVSKTWSY